MRYSTSYYQRSISSLMFVFFQGQSSSGGFDDTDDCMVPSTPTLYIPKRSDGFSEMIR